MRLRVQIAALAVLAIIATTGCAATTVPSDAEGRIAVYGITVANTIGELQQATIALNKSGVLPATTALRAQEAYREIAERGRELASVLRVIDATRGTPPEADISRARQLASQISESVVAIAAIFTSDNTSSQIRDLLRALVQATNTILFELGRE